MRSFLNRLSVYLISFLSVTTVILGNEILDKIDFSGFLRTRFWVLYTQNALAGRNLPEDRKNQTVYQDIFFRNRFKISVLPQVHIGSVFDIFTVFGGKSEGDIEITGGALDQSGFNISTRNLYLDIEFPFDILITVGLQPFSLPDGFILAKDGAGIKYDHKINKYLNLYAFWIKAIENSLTDSNLDGFGDFSLKDNDIYSIGNELYWRGKFKTDLYYIFQNDGASGDFEKGQFGWVGFKIYNFHEKLNWSLAMILNHGSVKIDSQQDDMNILAGLWSLELEYQIEDFDIVISHRGATGDIRKKYMENSFQTVSHSSGYSYIFLDDSGGVSIREGGELYGTYAFGAGLNVHPLDEFNILLKYIHFRSFHKIEYENLNSDHLGNEINLSLEYKYLEKVQFTLATGFFFPGRGYSNWAQYNSDEPIYEVQIACRVDY